MTKYVDISNFKVLNKIKSSGFNSFFSVQDIKTSETYTAEVFDSSYLQNKQKLEDEINSIENIQHPTVSKFYGYSNKDFDGKDNITLLFHLTSKFTLADLLLKVEQGLSDDKYDNTARQKILIGVARGMMYLHQHHAIHRNLRPENILLDDNLEPHITGYELSKLISTGNNNNQSKTDNSFIYKAPESIENNQYNNKSDTYSFGILMYAVVTNSIPYAEYQQNEDTLSQLKSKIINENYRPQFSTQINPKIRSLIDQCLSKDPNDRPTFKEIYTHLTHDNNEYNLNSVSIQEIHKYTHKIDTITNSPQIDHNHQTDDTTTTTNNSVNEIRLHVKIVEAKNLTKSNPLVTLHLKSKLDQSEESTDYKTNTSNPVWNEEFDLFTNDKNDILYINMQHIKDSDDDDEDDNENDEEKMIDEISFPLNTLNIDDFSSSLLRKEIDITLNKKNVGKLVFELQAFKTNIEPFCTFSATGKKFIKQKVFACLTCNVTPENYLGICEVCAKKCHVGHDIRFDSVQSDFYCDCPGKCECKCMPKTEDLNCTLIENNGNPINQPMFYCKDCDSSCKFFICQNCAIKFHHEHKLIYLGIVKGKVCQNEKINEEESVSI